MHPLSAAAFSYNGPCSSTIIAAQAKCLQARYNSPSIHGNRHNPRFVEELTCALREIAF